MDKYDFKQQQIENDFLFVRTPHLCHHSPATPVDYHIVLTLNQYELGAVYLQFLSDDSLYVSHCRIVILGYDESSFIYLSLSI